MPILDDATLLERWKTRRDAEAFNEIFRRFADQVYGTCRRILRNDADAEEVAQECFLLLVRSGGDVRSSLGGWLHRVATTKSLDRIRRNAHRREREQVFDAARQTVEATWDDIQEHVDAAIETLPAPTRHAVVEHFIAGKTHAEVAVQLRVSRRAVSYRIERGLESIRRELGRRGVSVPLAAFGPFFADNAVSAPLSLKASLGKLAIAAGTVPGAGGATAATSLLGSLLVMKAKITATILVLCVLAACIIVVSTREDDFAAVSVVETNETSPAPAEAPELPQTVEVTAEPVPTPASEEVPEESPTLEDLLALSWAEVERILEGYPPIEGPASVSGVVFDQDGYPVSGAAILLAPANGWGKLPGVGNLSIAASSGADGAYAIEGIQHAGRYWVTASKPGYNDAARGESSTTPLMIAADKHFTDINLKLGAGLTLSGRVLTGDGTPVPDGLVHGMSLTGPNSMSIMERYVVRTDSGGYFTMGFEPKARGSVTALRVQSALHGSATFPDVVVQDAQPVELRLAAPSVIHGTVRNSEGAPAARSRLTFYGRKAVTLTQEDRAGIRDRSSFAGHFIAVCDDAGRYAVEVDAGLDYDVELAGSPNRKRDEVPALEPGEHREYNPIIESSGINVRGRLLSMTSGQAFDSPIAMAQVRALRDGQWVGSGHMNPGGGYELVLPDNPGEYTFQAGYMIMGEAFGDLSEPYELAGGDELELDLTLPDPQYFSVRAVDAEGNPLAGVAVNFMTARAGTFTTGIWTNEEGHVGSAVAMPPECGARLWMEKPGYATAWGPLHEDQSPGTVHPEEVIVLWPGAGFEGDLVDGDGQPLAGAALSITVTNPDGQTWPLQATTDANGHFTIVDQAPADIVDITISSRNTQQGSWDVQRLQLQANAITSVGSITLTQD